jgi:hypothetical protein
MSLFEVSHQLRGQSVRPSWRRGPIGPMTIIEASDSTEYYLQTQFVPRSKHTPSGL